MQEILPDNTYSHSYPIPTSTSPIRLVTSETTSFERLSQIAAFYDSETEEYDNGYSTPLCQAEDRVWSHLIQNIVGSKVIDVGCGTGDFLKSFQPIEYVGLDISHQMAKIAHQKYGRAFIVANMHSLPFPDNYFDTLVSMYGPISYSLAPQELIQEFARVIRPEGSLIVMPYTKRVEKGEGGSISEKRILAGDYSTAINPDIKKVFYSTQMLKELFSGFDDVSIMGINFTANGIEQADKILQRVFKKEPLSVEFYQNYMLWELENMDDKDRLVEYARHAIVIARKPGKL